jgi:hypothetical protein
MGCTAVVPTTMPPLLTTMVVPAPSESSLKGWLLVVCYRRA